MQSFDLHLPTRAVFGVGAFARLGELARALAFRRTLLVADAGIAACGYVAQARALLDAAGIAAFHFQDFTENPDTCMVEAGRAFAVAHEVDAIIALGGGSSMDCAKGINFVLTGGGQMRDYLGHDKLTERTSKPMLPMIGVPTTAGTGSDGQSYALISDAETHAKMACGDKQAAFKIALLDPQLTVTMPRELTALTGYDALSHAVEAFVTRTRNPASEVFAREAWRLLEVNYERVLNEPENLAARGAMLLGAHYAGLAIEHSMLGATHSCANPLTKNFGTAHGQAIALFLPHIVRWNANAVGDGYRELLRSSSQPPCGKVSNEEAAELLARRLEQLRAAGGLPGNLRALGIDAQTFEQLAAEAAEQWTGQFNPRPWSAAGAREIYESAY